MQAQFLFSYPRDRTASVSASFSDDYVSTYKVIGNKGSLRMERAYAVPKDMPVKIFLEREHAIEEIAIEPADHFKLMIEDFCRETAAGSHSEKDYEGDLLAQARALEAAHEAHLQERTVRLSQLD